MFSFLVEVLLALVLSMILGSIALDHALNFKILLSQEFLSWDKTLSHDFIS